MKVDLSFQVPDYRAMDSEAKESKEEKKMPTKVEYPSLTICDDAAKQLIKSGVDVDGTVTATVKLKATSVRQVSRSEDNDSPMDCYPGSSGTSIDFDVIQLDGVNIERGDGDDGDGMDAEGAVDAYLDDKGLKRKK